MRALVAHMASVGVLCGGRSKRVSPKKKAGCITKAAALNKKYCEVLRDIERYWEVLRGIERF